MCCLSFEGVENVHFCTVFNKLWAKRAFAGAIPHRFFPSRIKKDRQMTVFLMFDGRVNRI